jgi:hypothetical protein
MGQARRSTLTARELEPLRANAGRNLLEADNPLIRQMPRLSPHRVLRTTRLRSLQSCTRRLSFRG